MANNIFVKEPLVKPNLRRNYSIDLLRILFMLLIIISHFWSHNEAGTISNSIVSTLLSRTIYSCVKVGVIGFAIISGYIRIKSEYRMGRIVYLWLETFFYCVLIYIIGFAQGEVSITRFIAGFFPVITGQYWYFTAYFFMFLLLPFINRLLLGITKKAYKTLLVILFVLVCIYSWGVSFFFNGFIEDQFLPHSTLYLIVLYCFGAYIRLYLKDLLKIRTYVWAIIFIICTAINVVSSKFVFLLPKTLIKHSSVATSFNNAFYSITSPTIVIAALSFTMFFVSIYITNATFGKILKFIAPLTFGAYLIVNHYYFDKIFIMGTLSDLFARHGILAYVFIIGIAVLLFVACLVVDMLRRWLFYFIRVDQLCFNINKKIKNSTLRKKLLGDIKD